MKGQYHHGLNQLTQFVVCFSNFQSEDFRFIQILSFESPQVITRSYSKKKDYSTSMEVFYSLMGSGE